MRVATRGFTLIELLVVIAIIGVLSTIGLVELNGGREKARDAERIVHMRTLVQALQLYYDDNSAYPFPEVTDQYDNGYQKCQIFPPSGTLAIARCDSRTPDWAYRGTVYCNNRENCPDHDWLPGLYPNYLSAKAPLDPKFSSAQYYYLYTVERDIPNDINRVNLVYFLENGNTPIELGLKSCGGDPCSVDLVLDHGTTFTGP